MSKRYLTHFPKKVALICMGPSVVDLLSETLTQEFNLDFADERWVVNMSTNCFRTDVVFWMDDLAQQYNFKPRLIEALRTFGEPVITSKSYPELVPNSYDYPLQEICSMPLGPKKVPIIDILGKPYLNNGVAMAIAYAMHKQVEILKIYGADFSYPNRDYAESGRACVETWIALASYAGVQVQLCPNTSLLDAVKDHGIYGYAEQPAIELPDGRVFQYKRPDPNSIGRYGVDAQPHNRDLANAGVKGYVPEDSSGAKPNGLSVPTPIPGSAANGLDRDIEASPPPAQPASVAG